MSEAQWATFLSTLNMGDGVPCTIERIQGAPVPAITQPPARHEQFKHEAGETIMECTGALKDALDMLANMGGEKSKAGMVAERVRCAQRALTDALPWVAQQFGEHMEAVTEKAKVEISAYAQGVISRAGIAALKDVTVPIALTDDSKERQR